MSSWEPEEVQTLRKYVADHIDEGGIVEWKSWGEVDSTRTVGAASRKWSSVKNEYSRHKGHATKTSSTGSSKIPESLHPRGSPPRKMAKKASKDREVVFDLDLVSSSDPTEADEEVIASSSRKSSKTLRERVRALEAEKLAAATKAAAEWKAASTRSADQLDRLLAVFEGTVAQQSGVGKKRSREEVASDSD